MASMIETPPSSRSSSKRLLQLPSTFTWRDKRLQAQVNTTLRQGQRACTLASRRARFKPGAPHPHVASARAAAAAQAVDACTRPMQTLRRAGAASLRVAVIEFLQSSWAYGNDST
eukprot:560362-Pleurochrysis_carterae.AAC.1